MVSTYSTLTGRTLPLGGLSPAERELLSIVHRRFRPELEWSELAAWWVEDLRRLGVSERSSAYRICQDLEARLGIAQGQVAPPDNRDYLADLIEGRYGSRREFCSATGVDPALLSRVLASRSALSMPALQPS